jgi:hypothetical protein
MRYRGLQLATAQPKATRQPSTHNSNLRDEGYFAGLAKDRRKPIDPEEAL